MMDLPCIQVLPTPTLSRKRPRDSQDLQIEGSKAHTYYTTVRAHASWDAAPQVYINNDQDDEADEDLILTSASPSRSVSSSSTWKRRRVSKPKDDSELGLEYLDSIPPSPWIDNCRQPSPLELTDFTTPNEEQDIPKERKRHREEWEELKGLYMEALAAYESGRDPRAALDLFRRVIEECHGFLVVHSDPSILFTPLIRNKDGTWSPQNLSGPDERLFRNWSGRKNDSVSYTAPNEHPTAFHTVCGSALLCFGNLLATYPSLEPVTRTYGCDWSGTDYYYWLCALDVFESGDNLPSRSKVISSVTSEDWRMSVAWGYALVSLAKAVQTRALVAKNLPPSDMPLLVEEPKWPLNSPFHPNMSKRPPLTRRLQLQRASAQDLLLLARDHLYRGMLYMPRSGWSPAGLFSEAIVSLPIGEILASTVTQEFLKMSALILGVAERFEEPPERQRWAQFADMVLNAVKSVEDKRWKASILLARGKCKLAAGLAKMQELSMERGPSSDVTNAHRAQYARKALSAAITLFEQVRQISRSNCDEERHSRDLLITAHKYCSDLCTSPAEWSQFYVPAKASSGRGVAMDVAMDVTI